MNMNLSYSVYKPEGDVKAVVFVVHGMQEHKNRYAELAEYLKARNIAVVTYDLPGHGETTCTEAKGYFGKEDGWGTLVSSAKEIAQFCRFTFPQKPLVFLGHSMGTMIARTFLQKNDTYIDGMILSGAPSYTPAAKLGKAIASFYAKRKGELAYEKKLTALAVGGFARSIKDAKTPIDWLSYNEDNVKQYFEDPNCGFDFTTKGYYDLFDGMIRMNDVSRYQCHNPNLPIYFFAGKDDPCIGGEKGFQASINTLKKAGYTHIDEKLYAHMRHETMHEDNRELVFEDVYQWIVKNMLK